MLGRLSDKAAAGLEQHLLSCGRCCALLRTLPADDTLVEAVRARAKVALHPAEQDVVEGLMGRMRKLRPVAASAHDTATGERTKGDAEPMSANRESFGFLNPPQNPEELGRLGPYRVLKVLGHGGMGMVFLAEDPRLKRTVALKVMLPEVAKKETARERFLREARATAAIEHDHIITIYQVDEDRGVPYLAMPLLKGMSLEQYLKRAKETKKPLTLGQILKLAREIAKGLAAAHERGLIHRDIKPANIWLDATAGGRVKILDFGLARPTETDSTITQSGMIVGTPAYMAPEQAAGQKIDGRADLFSLGVVLYRLCSGRVPWHGETAMATLMAVATEEETPLGQLNPDLPPALTELVAKLLAKKPEGRLKSAKAVVEAIVAIEKQLAADKVPVAQTFQVEPSQWQQFGEQSETAPLVKVRKPIKKKPRRWPLVAVAAAVLLIGGGVALWQVIIRVETKDGKSAELKVPDRSTVTVKDDGKIIVQPGKAGAGQGGDNAALQPGDIDLLKLIDPQKHAVKGKWRFENQQLVTPRDLFDRLQIPVTPPLAYELEMVATRTEGQDSLNLGLVCGNHRFILTLDGYKGKVSGLTYLDGLDVHRHEFWYRQRVFTNGQPCRISCMVRPQGIRVTADDKEIVNWQDYARLTMSPSWELPNKTQLGIGPGADTVYHIQKLVLRPIASGSGVDDGWIASVQKLPAEKQVEAVVAKLKELNPGFEGLPREPIDGSRTLKIENGTVTELRFYTDQVTNIAPVRALTGLKMLDCIGSASGKGKLIDLSPVRGLSLVGMSCMKNPGIEDLSPLAGMPLRGATIADTAVRSLAPLQGMPLTRLHMNGTKIEDLSPLRGMKLKTLYCYKTPVHSLEPLTGMPLELLHIQGTSVADLKPLAGMPLSHLECGYTPVADLSPLVGLKLTFLTCERSRVTDLSALKDMPLKEVRCDFVPARDAATLRAIKTLEKINGQPAAEILKQASAANAAFEQWLKDTQKLPAQNQLEEVKKKLIELNPRFDGKMTHKIEKGTVVTELAFATYEVSTIAPVKALAGLKSLSCTGSWQVGRGQLADLSPLQGLPLVRLRFQYNHVTDLSPLRGMALTHLDCGYNDISDISVVQDMPLTDLRLSGARIRDLAILAGKRLTVLGCDGTLVSDLSPLRGMPLTSIYLRDDQVDVAEVKTLLRGMHTLGSINNQRAIDFWKTRDPKHAAFLQWIETVRTLPAQKQVEAVAAKLKELNPGFDSSKVTHKIEGGTVIELNLITEQVADISPVRVLGGVQKLICRPTVTDYSPNPPKGKLADLSPLKGMALIELNVNQMQLADLSPLQGMPLKTLHVSRTNVTSLAPLKGLQLVEMVGDITDISDLSPLQGMPLIKVAFDNSQVKDLRPLQGMRLTSLSLRNCQELDDLTPLKGMPLQTLVVGSNKVKDLSSLEGMPLARFELTSNQVEDLTPLQGMKLNHLDLQNCGRVRDLSPLKGMPLTWLSLQNLGVTDLSVVKGMPLAELNIDYCDFDDLRPLQNLPLTKLQLLSHPNGKQPRDLTPLQGLNLKEIWITPKYVTKGMDALRRMKSLEVIKMGHESSKQFTPAEFWKRYDAGEFSK
jgi:serine/threonine protein kinase/Leucine-rich repeat (LRR) protein